MASIEVYERAAGTRTYRVRWREGGTRAGKPDVETFGDYPTAVRFRNLVTTCGNRRPDRDQLCAFGFAALAGDPPTPAATLTVADVCAAYLDHLAARTEKPASYNTMKTYRRYQANYLAPTALGPMPAATFTALDVEDWQDELRRPAAGRRALGRTSVRNVRSGLLGAAFKWACSGRATRGGPLLDRHNPVPDADMLPEQRFQREILRTPEEYALLLHHARAIAPRWADLLELEAVTGLRKGEAAALDATDLVPRRGTLLVRRHLVAGTPVPGTKAGPDHFREVPLPAATMDRLAGRTGILLPAPMGGRWISDSHLWVKLRKALVDDGVPVHVTHHSLRHGLATWLAGDPWNMTEVKRNALLGHKPKTMGDRYAHTVTAADLDLARRAAAALLAG